MDTLRDRLADLADDAPTAGAPAQELWARGRRGHRLRAAALAATLLVVLGAVGTGIGVRLAEGDGHRSSFASVGPVDIALPITYPAGEDLPNLGEAPGPLAAIWVAPNLSGGSPRVVGLLAETGTFGTLQLSLPNYDLDGIVALSPDGRRIAYNTQWFGLIVRDLVSGETSPANAFEFETRAGFTWVDATHLVGHVAGGSDSEGWVWEPGKAPRLVDLREYPGSSWLGSHGGKDPWLTITGGGPERPCSSPSPPPPVDNEVPVYCEVVGVIGSDIVLTYWNLDVVALDRADFPFDDPALRPVVVTAGAPEQVTFASDVIAEALDAAGGAS